MKKIITLICISILFFSCSSDDAKSSENYIEQFTIAGIKPIQVNIKQDQNLIQILTFEDNREAVLNATPEIVVSRNATWSKNGQNWVVTAENGETRSYSIQIIVPSNKYSFEEWETSNGGYYAPSGPNSMWTSGNPGISTALSMLGRNNKDPEIYPTKKTSEAYGGSKAVLLETIEGGVVFEANYPIFSGNFFLGNFNMAKMTTPLIATEVGSIYPKKPKKVTGFYKYKEGPGDFNNNGTPEPGRRDSCNLGISFYQGDSPTSGKDTILAVMDIDDSELVIARATLPDCSETAGDGFHEFSLDFGTYAKEPDFTNHYYKIVITFAASRNGDKYAGKIGSKLIIDEVEIEDY